MAFAREVYTGNGVNRLFNVPFPYLSTSHVEVRVAGVLQSAYTWINATTIQMTTAPASGEAVEVKRNTPKTFRLVDWADGSGLREADLDLADLQVLYITQEAFDAASLTIGEDAQGRWDALNKRLSNVAAPVDPNDAVNKSYVDPVLAAATTQANNAANSAAAALTSETNADAARVAAENARNAAQAAAATLPVAAPADADKWLKINAGGTGWDYLTAVQARTALGLGSAATLTAGTGANNLVQLNGSARLPAVDGSLLTGINAGSRSGVRNLTGQNNSGTPNTQYDFAASEVVLTNGSGGYVARQNTGTITCNVLTAGPAINGRDQAGAFTAASWVHFYFIWNGTTLATIASTNATAPTLPSGYTHYAYLGAVYFNGASQLVTTRVRGSRVYYASPPSMLSGSATSETAINLATAVPPNASTGEAQLFAQIVTSAPANSDAMIRWATGNNYVFQRSGSATSDSTQGRTVVFEFPNVGQSLFYLFTNEANPGNITGRTAQLNILSYTIPNGDS